MSRPPYVFHSLSVCAACGECGEFLDATEVSVEAFEVTGQILCASCAQEAFEAMQPEDDLGLEDEL